MESRSHAIIAVTFLVLFAAAITGLVIWLERGKPESKIYEIVTTQDVSGLEPQADVKFRGLVVGHVTHVGFDPSDPQKVLIRIGIYPDVPVTHATYTQLHSQLIGGVASIDLETASGKSQAPLQTSTKHPARLPLRPGLLQSVKQSAKGTLTKVQEVLQRADSMLSDENRHHLTQTIAQLDEATRHLVALEQHLTPTVEALPGLTQDLQQTLAESNKVLKQVSELAAAAHRPLREAPGAMSAVKDMSDAGTVLARKLTEQTLPELDALTRHLTRTSQSVDELVRLLRAQPQSVLFGAPAPPPGPGEPGFEAPSVNRKP